MNTASKYTGYGYHGGGRPKKPEGEKIKSEKITVSGRPEEIAELRKRATEAGQSIARYVFNNTIYKNT